LDSNNPASIFVLVTGTSPTSVEPIQHAPGGIFFSPHLSKKKFFPRNRGRINFIDTKAKFRHVKKWTRAAGVYQSLWIGNMVSHIEFVFLTQLCELLPIYPSLVQ
jgi:hypothetical protein